MIEDMGEVDEYQLFGDFLRDTEQLDADRNFAKPIEDEDLFGCGSSSVERVEEPEDEADPDEFFPEVLDDTSLPSNHCQVQAQAQAQAQPPISPNHVNNENEHIHSLETPAGNNTTREKNDEADVSGEQAQELDDIFLDNYESDTEVNNTSNLNVTKSYANRVQLPSPAQIKKSLFKDRILQQAKAMGLEPKLASDFKHTNTISFMIDQDKLTSNQSSKFFFNKMFNASTKSNKSPEKCKWSQHKRQLRLDICAQKRKVWDSFQHPITLMDEEEEILEMDQETSENVETIATDESDCEIDEELLQEDNDEDKEDPTSFISDHSDSDNDDDENKGNAEEERDHVAPTRTPDSSTTCNENLTE